MSQDSATAEAYVKPFDDRLDGWTRLVDYIEAKSSNNAKLAGYADKGWRVIVCFPMQMVEAKHREALREILKIEIPDHDDMLMKETIKQLKMGYHIPISAHYKPKNNPSAQPVRVDGEIVIGQGLMLMVFHDMFAPMFGPAVPVLPSDVMVKGRVWHFMSTPNVAVACFENVFVPPVSDMYRPALGLMVVVPLAEDAHNALMQGALSQLSATQ